MADNWFNRETKSLYIARPDTKPAGLHDASFGDPTDLIYKHPDNSIPRGAKLTVRSSECALFFREGRFVGRVDAGTIQLDTANIPFLGHLLINGLTGGNHFLCELFFVSLNETVLKIDKTTLGQYRDLNSARVVGVEANLSYTVRVTDPLKLIVELSGQRQAAGDAVRAVLNGRLLNQVRRVVGGIIQQRPVLDVVSNADAEAISEEVRRVGHTEFLTLGVGIGRLFDMSLNLDHGSLDDLRQFGLEESNLALQAKGAHLATQDGFAQFNYVQGQRAAMEGLGQGLGRGAGPMIMTGLNVGGAFGAPSSGLSRPAARPTGGGAPILSGQVSYLMTEPMGETGPYSVRQIALIALSKGLPLSAVILRRSDDPPGMTFTADFEPAIVAEYQRRAPKSQP